MISTPCSLFVPSAGEKKVEKLDEYHWSLFINTVPIK